MSKALEIVQKHYPQVTSVKDATKSLVIEVTRKDTSSRAVKNHKECALAWACKRVLEADGAIICVKSAYIIKGDKATRYLLPGSVSREITAFDRNAPFEPGVYTLCRVPPSLVLGTTRKFGSKRRKSKPIHYHRTENIRHIGDIA